MPEQVEGARSRPIGAGLIARAVAAARYTITGVIPQGFFGPLQPLPPITSDPTAHGRQWDYPQGWNINYVPRSQEAIDFDTLRALADNCDVLRGVIEARKDQVASLDWVIRQKVDPNDTPSNPLVSRTAIRMPQDTATKERAAAATKFFQYPDRSHSWDQWQRMVLEDMLVIDAPAIERRQTKGGKLHSLDIIDGATIFPLIDGWGRTPTAPSPAYQQIIKGVVAADFTSEELLYLPKNVRSNKVYGYSPTEQVVVTVNTAIRRALFQLEYYRSGSQPDAFVGLPPTWSLQSVRDFQNYFDALHSGNLAQRRKIKFMPGDFKYVETKQWDMKDQYDEWLARIVCFIFAVDPTPFITHITRGSGQTSRNRALEEGMAPTQRYIKSIIDRILAEDFGSSDLEFVYIDDREQDPSAQANTDVAYTKAGIKSIDEVRATRGLATLGGAYAKPMLATAQGYVTVGELTSQGKGVALPDTSGTEDAPKEPDAQGVRQTPGETPPDDPVGGEASLTRGRS